MYNKSMQKEKGNGTIDKHTFDDIQKPKKPRERNSKDTRQRSVLRRKA